jgi:hypothetical protein
MIPDQWKAIPDSNSVPNGRPVSVMRRGERLILCSDGWVLLYRRRRVPLDADGFPENP